MTTKAANQEETFGFQAEAQQLLHFMIHSLYSNREIFLRELISNASDAIDRLRFEALSSPELADGTDFAVTIDYDKDAGTLSVTDNGIGMSRQEVIDNIGTIARSGTSRFLKSLTGDDKKDAQLIGQFGVGFYSAFIVAKKVEVFTRRAGEDKSGTHFRSTGKEDFYLRTLDNLERGTKVLLHLKKDARDFLDGFRLRQVIKKYADHLSVVVRMPKDQDDPEDSTGEKGEEPGSAFEVINQAKALWTRPRTEIKKEEYEEFYKLLTHDLQTPLTWSHNKVEGKLEYTSLLFLPSHAPFDLYNREAPRGLKLYVQRMFIMDEAEQFLPLYLRFVRGVIDTSDLPLNVSRELLQEDKRVQTIRNALTKRVFSMLNKLMKSKPEEYDKFWHQFGPVMKEGLVDDEANHEAIQKLLKFPTALKDDNTHRPLSEYVEDMPEGQDKIYYLVGDDVDVARQSPHLEMFKAKKQNVLLCCDRVDVWVMLQMKTFKDKEFQDITRADVNLDEASAGEDETASKDTTQGKDQPESEADVALMKKISATLEGRVDEVRASRRLTDSPACLVLGESGMGARMRDLMVAATGQALPESSPIFEINLQHPLVVRLHKCEQQSFDDLVMVLFDQAHLLEGATLSAPATFVNRLNRLLEEVSID